MVGQAGVGLGRPKGGRKDGQAWPGMDWRHVFGAEKPGPTLAPTAAQPGATKTLPVAAAAPGATRDHPPLPLSSTHSVLTCFSPHLAPFKAVTRLRSFVLTAFLPHYGTPRDHNCQGHCSQPTPHAHPASTL